MDKSVIVSKRERAVNNILAEAQELLEQGEYEKAEEALIIIPEGARTAEWYFINGSILKGKGRFLDAQAQFEAAASLEPDNQTYIQATEELKNSANSYVDTWGVQNSSQENSQKCNCCCCIECDPNSDSCDNCCGWCCEGCGEGCCYCICESICEGCDGC